MQRMNLFLALTMVAAALTVGCTYDRPAQKVIQPSYSHRQADSTLTADEIWPVRDHRSARATHSTPRSQNLGNEDAIE